MCKMKFSTNNFSKFRYHKTHKANAVIIAIGILSKYSSPLKNRRTLIKLEIYISQPICLKNAVKQIIICFKSSSKHAINVFSKFIDLEKKRRKTH